jgi:hypothetical protein
MLALECADHLPKSIDVIQTVRMADVGTESLDQSGSMGGKTNIAAGQQEMTMLQGRFQEGELGGNLVEDILCGNAK